MKVKPWEKKHLLGIDLGLFSPINTDYYFSQLYNQTKSNIKAILLKKKTMKFAKNTLQLCTRIENNYSKMNF